MIHRVSQVTVEEINRVLRLVQETSQNQTLTPKGFASRKPDNPTSTVTNLQGKVQVEPTPNLGVTSTMPVILSATISTSYPDFGFGANWGESWGL
jgi:hypothetical protein